MPLQIRRAAIAAAAALSITAGALGVGAVAAGEASAEIEVPMTRCFGLSPNVIDQPFAPARAFVYQQRPGTADVAINDIASLWFFAGGYQSDGRLDWRNLDNGRKGTAVKRSPVSYPGNSSMTFPISPGTGRVELTFSAVNRNALWAIPTTSCTGTVVVP